MSVLQRLIRTKVQVDGITNTDLMSDDIVSQGTIALGRRGRPEEHLHQSALAIGRGGEVRIVEAGSVLDGNLDAILVLSSKTIVVVLEVEGRLGEAIFVGDVMDRVDNVEGVRTGEIQVLSGSRSRLGVVLVDVLARGGLRCDAGLATLVSDGVVATLMETDERAT